MPNERRFKLRIKSRYIEIDNSGQVLVWIDRADTEHLQSDCQAMLLDEDADVGVPS